VPQTRWLRKIPAGQVLIIAALLAGFYLLLIAIFEILQYLPYFRFLLLVVMGFAFLIISYLLKQ
jgi:hypothetical protein